MGSMCGESLRTSVILPDFQEIKIGEQSADSPFKIIIKNKKDLRAITNYAKFILSLQSLLVLTAFLFITKVSIGFN